MAQFIRRPFVATLMATVRASLCWYKMAFALQWLLRGLVGNVEIIIHVADNEKKTMCLKYKTIPEPLSATV